MTKIAAVAPSGECPLWHGFLERVTDGDKELQLYLQRVAGYCLTGSVEEEALFFLYGTSQNGKGVFIHTLAGIFNEFHTAAPMEMFLFSKNDRHPTELAGLRGTRLVTCTEVEEGRRWDEAKISPRCRWRLDRVGQRRLANFFELNQLAELALRQAELEEHRRDDTLRIKQADERAQVVAIDVGAVAGLPLTLTRSGLQRRLLVGQRQVH